MASHRINKYTIWNQIDQKFIRHEARKIEIKNLNLFQVTYISVSIDFKSLGYIQMEET